MWKQQMKNWWKKIKQKIKKKMEIIKYTHIPNE